MNFTHPHTLSICKSHRMHRQAMATPSPTAWNWKQGRELWRNRAEGKRNGGKDGLFSGAAAAARVPVQVSPAHLTTQENARPVREGGKKPRKARATFNRQMLGKHRVVWLPPGFLPWVSSSPWLYEMTDRIVCPFKIPTCWSPKPPCGWVWGKEIIKVQWGQNGGALIWED